MKLFLSLAVVAVFLGPPAPTDARAEGDEVIIIYNGRVPESRSVAEHYAERRHVPKNQVLGFDLTTAQEISRSEFHNELQKPLLRKLQSLKLWRFGPGEIQDTNGRPVRVQAKVLESKIRYAVLCYGMPLKVLRDTSLKEAAEETMRLEFRRNEAAVDSELACLPRANENLPLAGPLRNSLYGTTNAWSLHPTNGVLLVTRLDGPSPEIADALVDKAIEAETDGLWGRAYIDLRSIAEPGMKLGDDWIRSAGEACRYLGLETVVDTNPGTFATSFPMSQIAIYIGWYTETVNGPFALPKVEFMPGAFAYHLHSFSAASLRTTDHYWAGPLLAKGATITMGCVDEPYLAFTPDVAVFMSRFVFQGFTFGEAAYAGQSALSWQTTVVGDPLYQPFKKPPKQLHQELEARHDKLLEWSYLRLLDQNLVRGRPLAELVNYLETIPTTKDSAVLKEKLADLYTSQGKPSSASLTYEQALKLGSSPQQRIRLRLILGEKLTAENRDADAYVNYQKFVEESPDYADRISIYRKLLELAQKLGKKGDAVRYEEQIKGLTSAAPGKR